MLGCYFDRYDLRAAFYRVRNLRFDLFALYFRMHGTQTRILVQTISEFEPLYFSDELLDELSVDALDHIQSLHRQARLTAVVEPADGCSRECFIDIGVFTHDHRITAAELQRDPFHLAAGNLHDVFTGLALARKRDAADLGVAQDLFTNHAAGAGHDVEHAFRQTRLVQQFHNASGC